MKYLVQTENITEETKMTDYNRVILDNTDGNVYVKPQFNFVDLGLSSGTLWMDRNIGAKEITDYGLYFQWGDTQGYTADEVGTKKNFNWDDYKYANGAYNKLTKYCNKSSYGNRGYTDNLTELELSDDAAYAYTNGKCKMPTRTQFTELINGCTYEWTTKDGVTGGLFTSKTNGNSIFIPNSGHYSVTSLYNKYSTDIWSTIFDDTDAPSIWTMEIDEDKASTDEYSYRERYYGIAIRGVFKTN